MTRPDEELAERVAKEIRQLHKGRGLQAGDLDSRLGPLLGELAGTGEVAAPRKALTAEINRCADQLLDDYRIAIGASLALSAETIDEPLFTRRASWLADRLDRDNRTALRRIREAESAAGQAIVAELRRSPAADPGSTRRLVRGGTPGSPAFRRRHRCVRAGPAQSHPPART